MPPPPPRRGYLSSGFNLWTFPAVFRSSSYEDARDAPGLARSLTAELCYERVHEAWLDECAAREPGQRSLVRVAFRLERARLLLGIFSSFTQGVLFSVARPLVLRQIILATAATTGAARPNISTASSLTGLVVAYCAISFCEGILNVVARQQLGVEGGSRFMLYGSALLLSKSTRISSTASSTSGRDAVSLMTSDLIRVCEDWRWGSQIVFSCTSIVGCLIVLGVTLGVTSIPGIVVMLFIFLFNRSLGARIRANERRNRTVTDRRTSLVRDLTANVLGLKVLAWEEPYRKLLERTRLRDTDLLSKNRNLSVSSINAGRASPVIAGALSIITIAYTAPTLLSASTIFTALMAFQSLRLPLIVLPQNLIQIANGRVALARIIEYLNQPEFERPQPPPISTDASSLAVRVINATFEVGPERRVMLANNAAVAPGGSVGGGSKSSRRFILRSSSVRMATTAPGAAALLEEEEEEDAEGDAENPHHRGGAGEDDNHTSSNNSTRRGRRGSGGSTTTLFKSPFALRDVNLEVPRQGAIVGVCGKIGSGKSVLLKGILGHVRMSGQGAKRQLSDSVEYAPQKPFVLSGTLQENILVGRPLDQDRMDFALRASCLRDDIAAMPFGMLTAIGERGQTLSGGQKARLSLARCFYADPELMLLDDVLSALDVAVAGAVFAALEEFVHRKPNRSVIVALNQLHLLPRCTHVVMLAGGAVAEQGEYTALTQNNPDGPLSMLVRQGAMEWTGATLSPTAAASARVPPPTIGEEEKKTEEGGSNPAPPHVLLGGAPSMVVFSNATTPAPAPAPAPAPSSSAVAAQAAQQVAAAPPPGGGINNDTMFSKEVGERGVAFLRVLERYIRPMGRLHLPVAFLTGFAAYAILSANDLLLTQWVTRSTTNSFEANVESAGIYVALALSNVCCVQLLSLWNSRGSVRSMRTLHAEAVDSLLHAPLLWYETTPSGRIVSRMSSDLDMVDRSLTFVFDDTIHFSFIMLGLTIVVGIIAPFVVPVFAVSFIMFLVFLRLVDRANRESKRLANQLWSPIVTNAIECSSALVLIQTSRVEAFFVTRYCQGMDEFMRFSHLSYSVINTGTMLTGVLAFLISVGAAFIVVFSPLITISPSQVGLALVYSQTFPYFLNILAQVLPIGFSALTSLERVLELTGDHVPKEDAWTKPDDPSPKTWPSAGEIVFEDVVFTYREGLPPALKGLSFHVEPGELVGFCGRTGSGKSTTLMALTRIRELTSGRVLIDGVDVSKIGVQTLRAALIVIPQEPLLLAGSVRFNLDPFEEFSREAIEEVALSLGMGLDVLNARSATSVSAGQRQLIAMCRALLKGQKSATKIVLMDESTANVDSVTDKLIENLVKVRFAGKTRFVIAHRLASVSNADKIVVMRGGVAVQMGSPAELLRDKSGLFYSMVKAYREGVAE